MYLTYHEDLGTTPARVNRYTGEIQLNLKYWPHLPEFHQKFIIEHESGHFLKNTRSEFQADKYAFDHLAGSAPRSLKESVYSISKVLSFRNPQHMDRLLEILKMALRYDATHNGNEKAKKTLEQLNSVTLNYHNQQPTMSQYSSYHEPRYYVPSSSEDDYDNISGKRAAKKAEKDQRKADKKDAKQRNKDLKNDRKEAKNNVINAKADSKRSRAEAKRTKAEKGDGTSWWDKTLNTVGGLFGKSASGSADTSVQGAEQFETVNPNDGKILGMPKGVAIGVILLIVAGIIVGIVFAVKASKK